MKGSKVLRQWISTENLASKILFRKIGKAELLCSLEKEAAWTL
jgi:hypothetical protein